MFLGLNLAKNKVDKNSSQMAQKNENPIQQIVPSQEASAPVE